mmetsp:Transcript_26061/g.57471  ORF Transcript_26061/g.57471 Transcript_26061/m.57471 type:complete len:230 (+) Transcript_26061:54-743(+)
MPFASPTAASQQRSRSSAPGEGRRVARPVHHEHQAEEAVISDFEASTRRVLRLLSGQVRALRDSLDALAQSFTVQLKASLEREELRRTDFERSVGIEMGEAARRAERMADDLEELQSLVPKLERSVTSSRWHMEAKMEQLATSVERVELKLREVDTQRWATELREELEQRQQQMQRSIGRELDSMSRLLEEGRTPSRPLSGRGRDGQAWAAGQVPELRASSLGPDRSTA